MDFIPKLTDPETSSLISFKEENLSFLAAQQMERSPLSDVCFGPPVLGLFSNEPVFW